MCLVAAAVDVSRRYELVLAANRDELFARPAAPLARWADMPNVWGGRDLEKGGGWLALRDDGRYALVTNYRDFRRARREGAPSRGELVAAAVRADLSPEAHVAELERRSDDYEPFNLLVGDRQRVVWHSNVARATKVLPPGVHGLSNALLDTPWPKVEALTSVMRSALELEAPALEALLLGALASRAEAPPATLPDTGVGAELEARLSAAFILLPGYGTRCSSVITVARDGQVRFVERTFDSHGNATATRVEAFDRLR